MFYTATYIFFHSVYKIVKIVGELMHLLVISRSLLLILPLLNILPSVHEKTDMDTRLLPLGYSVDGDLGTMEVYAILFW